VPELYNLVVDLNQSFETACLPGVEVTGPAAADDRTLAWIDEAFGGSWSSEAFAGSNLVARRNGSPVGFVTIEPEGLTFAWLDGVAREPGVGIIGPIGVAREERDHGLGTLMLRRALMTLRERGYARGLLPAVSKGLVPYYADSVNAQIAERFDRASLYRPGRRVLVMASGNGSNFQAVLDASRSGDLPVEVAALLCNDAKAFAVERARRAALDNVLVLSWNRKRESREAYDAGLLEAARSVRPDLVLLLGWMHLLAPSFIAAFPQLLNLHPAFLPLDPNRDEVVMPDGTRGPAFRGPRAVADALSASSVWVGATLHRVTNAMDRGPVLTRKPLRVQPGEDETRLMERVHELERGVVRTGLMRWLLER
jgi:phosphoribosylglycinamide formyltransferase 1